MKTEKVSITNNMKNKIGVEVYGDDTDTSTRKCHCEKINARSQKIICGTNIAEIVLFHGKRVYTIRPRELPYCRVMTLEYPRFEIEYKNFYDGMKLTIQEYSENDY